MDAVFRDRFHRGERGGVKCRFQGTLRGVTGRSSDAITEAEGGTRINVRLTPRASKNEVVGEREAVLVVRVTAPPADNRANQGLCKLLAKELGIAKGRVAVVGGAKSRDKVIQVEGMAPEEARAALGLSPARRVADRVGPGRRDV